MIHELSGLWTAELADGRTFPMRLPGTLDTNGIGDPDTGSNQWHPDAAMDSPLLEDAPVIATRFTRKFTYEGPVRISRTVSFRPVEGKRVFLDVGHARCLSVLADDAKIPDFLPPSLSTPRCFELTGRLTGSTRLVLISDNSYPDMPKDSILFSSAATDETQTNWNGIPGRISLREEEPVFLCALQVYPKGNTLTVRAHICSDRSCAGTLRLVCDALTCEPELSFCAAPGVTTLTADALPLREDVPRWDEGEGNLLTLTGLLAPDSCEASAKTVTFGVRDMGYDERGRLTLNNRAFFLRGEACCAAFPETGHPPMTVEEWTDILSRYRSYGINYVRFHSHCPPEAAFTAADHLGMMMQPELSCWDPKDAFGDECSFSCYSNELYQILYTLANHPSFVMLTFGNELHAGQAGHERMRQLLRTARELDDTRLYADGSNAHYGALGADPESDFYTSQCWKQFLLRGTCAAQDPQTRRIEGHINNRYPGADVCYDEAIRSARRDWNKPIISFEVGQFEVLPDFEELDTFRGVLDPANLRLIRSRAEQAGLLPLWPRMVEATGQLSRIGYREEIEAAMRTEGLSGICLLGLQDFPGQGTALVGMMNSHLQPKTGAFSDPKAFSAFFRDTLPLILLPRYTYETTDTLEADVVLANYGKKTLAGSWHYELGGAGVHLRGSLGKCSCPAGHSTPLGKLQISLEQITEPSRLELTVSGPFFDGQTGSPAASNTYPVWVYPPVQPVCPGSIHEARSLDQEALRVLEAGGCVYLSPSSTREQLPSSIQAQFTTDFWSVGTFPLQEGGMGQLIDASHPLFASFPTETHTNWQWWPMAVQRAIILPRRWQAIVTEMDSYAYLRPMAQLLECRCGGGRLLLSSLGLQDLQQYPEARALLNAIYTYMTSDTFSPVQEIDPADIAALVSPRSADNASSD